jgi:hypothetical protein
MSQFARLSRNPGPEPGRPSRVADGYLDVFSARLRKLAATRSTGTLPFSGRGDGAIYFRDGLVAGAESSGTPAGPPARSGSDQAAPRSSAGLVAALARLEPVIDAALDLLQCGAPSSRFRSARGQAVPGPVSLPVEVVLSELRRRRHLLGQMAVLVTADSPVLRRPRLHAPRVQVSALHWALLIRAGAETTARDLAFDLDRSVFGTTAEVYRLMALRLLSVPDRRESAEPVAALRSRELVPAAISFVRAVSDGKGES